MNFRIVISLVFLLGSLSVQAQEMSVRQFFEATSDLTANTPGTMRKDQNGATCALIKVETTVDGFSWDVGSLGIVDTKREGGEIWVYVPYGVRKITISHPDFGVIRDYTFPHPLERARTYVLKLNVMAGSLTYDSSKKQKLILTVKPANSDIQINGMSFHPDEDGLLTQEIACGTHDLTVSATKYHPVHRSLSIRESDGPVRETIILKQAFGWLDVKCDELVSVEMDGSPLSNYSNKGIAVTSGLHQFTLRRTGHKPYQCTAEIKDSARVEIVPAFVPIYGTLHCTSSPDNAIVIIDDVYAGHTPGDFRVLVGSHTVEIKKAGHNSARHDVTVAEDQTVSINDKLTNIIPVTIRTTPSNAEVYVDGERRRSGEVDLVAGTHSIQLFAKGYMDYTNRFNVSDSDKEYHFKMKKKYYDRYSFYLGAIVGSSISDYLIGGYLGMYLGNVNLEGSILFGTTDIDYSYDTYRPVLYEGRLGYGFIIGSRVRLTPRIGTSYLYLSRNGSQKSSKGFNPESSDAYSFVFDLKANIAIANRLELSIIPEYDVATSKSDMCQALCETSPVVSSWIEGFKVSVGIGLFF